MKVWYGVLLCGLLAMVGIGTIARNRPVRSELPSKTTRLQASFLKDRWVAYTPTELDPRPAHFKPATNAGIQADLDVLRPYFNVLVTYSCNEAQGMDRIVPIAAKNHFRVCLGIWDVKSVSEISCAVSLARQFHETVLAVIVGNECLLSNRAKWEEIEAAIRLVRAALPDIPVSTSEPISSYGNDDLRRVVDFHSPTCHWIFQGSKRQDANAAVNWLQDRVQVLQEMPYGDKPLLIKEHGLPAGPAPFSPSLQAQYWTKWQGVMPRSRKCAFVFFEAFCAPWKSETNPSEMASTEAQWGAWDENRQPRPIVKAFSRR